MADYIAMDAAAVARHIDALLVTFPELADDEALRADMLEGSTDLHRVVSRALREQTDARAMLSGLKLVKEDLTQRRERWERRSEAMSVIIKSLMDAAGVPTLTLPEATLSMSRGRESVDIIDLDALPQGFFAVERKADKDALYKALKSGADIPGAALVRATPSLVVRMK
jgi:hypothetical protein